MTKYAPSYLGIQSLNNYTEILDAKLKNPSTVIKVNNMPIQTTTLETSRFSDMLNGLASSRMKEILNNAKNITPKDMILESYKRGVTDMALAIISSENSNFEYYI